MYISESGRMEVSGGWRKGEMGILRGIIGGRSVKERNVTEKLLGVVKVSSCVVRGVKIKWRRRKGDVRMSFKER